jgi:hypothetical protein
MGIVSFASFTIFLGFLWFLLYWILGGVFFALIAILRLGRVRKVRFSCLFSIWSLLCGAGASWSGVKLAQDSIASCYFLARTKAEVLTSFFGCGFAGIFGMFLLWAAILTLGGFFFMEISKNKHAPWMVLDETGDDEEEDPPSPQTYFS